MKASLRLEYAGRGFSGYAIPPSAARILGPKIYRPAFYAERIGRRSYICGATYEHREELKNAGFHWDSEERAWWVGSKSEAENVAEILSRHFPHYDAGEKFEKQILKPNTDFADANKRLTYGLYFYYILESECLYEVLNYVAWERTESYYATVTTDAKIIRVEDPEQWLTANAR
jgi:hypothetical protein